MKSIPVRFRYPLCVALTAIIAGYAWVFVIMFLFNPKLPEFNNNTNAYKSMVQGLQTGRFSLAKPYYEEAFRTATDEDLRYLADLNLRIANATLAAGVDSFQEANTWSGGFKGLVAGLLDLRLSIEGLAITIERWFTDLDAITSRLDERYFPTLQHYSKALDRRATVENWSGGMFWLCFIVVIFIGIKYRIPIKKQFPSLAAQQGGPGYPSQSAGSPDP